MIYFYFYLFLFSFWKIKRYVILTQGWTNPQRLFLSPTAIQEVKPLALKEIYQETHLCPQLVPLSYITKE